MPTDTDTHDDAQPTRRLTVTLDRKLFQRLKVEAAVRDVSLTDLTAVALDEYLERHGVDPAAYFESGASHD